MKSFTIRRQKVVDEPQSIDQAAGNKIGSDLTIDDAGNTSSNKFQWSRLFKKRDNAKVYDNQQENYEVAGSTALNEKQFRPRMLSDTNNINAAIQQASSETSELTQKQWHTDPLKSIDELTKLPVSELEPYVVNQVLLQFNTKPQLRSKIGNDEHQDLLISAIANQTFVAVQSSFQQLVQRQSYDVEALKKLVATHIDKVLVKVVKLKQSLVQQSKVIANTHASFTEKGLRDFNEDKHVAFSYMHELVGRVPQYPLSLFGVFDGHGGVECAHYVAQHFPLTLARHPSIDYNAKFVLHEAFMKTNYDWTAAARHCGFKENCGCTGVVALLHNKTLHIAWAGDSSAILFLKSGLWLNFIVPHKPSSIQELNRIQQLGGFVQNDRVNGILAVSRSFGDLKYGCVNPEPDMVEYVLQGQEDFLLLACDGLTDVMTPMDVIEVVKKTMQEPRNEHLISQNLVDAALNRGSTDNVSVVYVPLHKITGKEGVVLPQPKINQSLVSILDNLPPLQQASSTIPIINMLPVIESSTTSENAGEHQTTDILTAARVSTKNLVNQDVPPTPTSQP